MTSPASKAIVVACGGPNVRPILLALWESLQWRRRSQTTSRRHTARRASRPSRSTCGLALSMKAHLLRWRATYSLFLGENASDQDRMEKRSIAKMISMRSSTSRRYISLLRYEISSSVCGSLTSTYQDFSRPGAPTIPRFSSSFLS